jgi:hypothetical protein
VTAGRLGPPVTIVLEGRARAGADEADVDGVEVVHAPGEGDDTIAVIAEANREVVVVTADRELAERVRAANAEVVRPSWLLEQLLNPSDGTRAVGRGRSGTRRSGTRSCSTIPWRDGATPGDLCALQDWGGGRRTVPVAPGMASERRIGRALGLRSGSYHDGVA